MHPISPGGTAAQQDERPGRLATRVFHAAVALAQLTSWLPGGRRFLIDMSGPVRARAEVAACAGHSVLRVIDPQRQPGRPPAPATAPAGCATVTADGTGLEFLADGCADGVIAEDRTLSQAAGRRRTRRRDRAGAAPRRAGARLRGLADLRHGGARRSSTAGRTWSTCPTPTWCSSPGRTAPSPAATAPSSCASCSPARGLRGQLDQAAHRAVPARRSATCSPATRRASPTWSTRSCAPVATTRWEPS